MTKGHAILGSFGDISEAREKLHRTSAAQYVARIDGVVLAFMSREGQSWRSIHKVPPEVRGSLRAYAGVDQGQAMVDETDPTDAKPEDDLYPPPAFDPTEASSDL